MSSLVRIRLSFQRSLPFAEAKNCWFLLDTSTCSTIADLEYLIKERFGGSSKSSSRNLINLYLDDYLLPSQEKIDIIQQNDNIRVVLEQFIVTMSSSEEEDESCQDAEQNVKRKKKKTLPDVRNKSKKKSKKKSPLPSTSCVTTHDKSNDVPVEKTSKVSKKKHKMSNPPETQPAKSNASKRKNVDNAEPSTNTTKKSKTSANGIGKGFCAGKNVVRHESNSSESSSSMESSSESPDESGPSKIQSKACTKNVNGIKSTDLKVTKGRIIYHGKCLPHGMLGKDVKNKTSAFALQKESKGKAANGITPKSSSATRGKQEGNCAAKPSSSSSSLSTGSLSSEESESILKKGAKKKDMSYLSSSQLSLSLTSPRSSSEKECAKTGENNKKKSGDVIRTLSSQSLSTLSSPSSSRNEEDSITQSMYKKTETLLYPLSSSSLPLPSSSSPSSSSDKKHEDRTVTSVNQSTTSNFSEKDKCTGQMNALQRTNRPQNRKSGAGHIRFDSEDDTIEEQEEVRSRNNITDGVDSTMSYPNSITSNQNVHASSQKATKQKEPVQRDYSLCTPLHGPPRSRDKIAFKVLELSASYTPEVSAYKEGTVLSYEPNSGAVKIELTKESLKNSRAPGDGNVSRKFELDYDDDQENGENVNDEETDAEVVVLWSSMFDPVLISD